MRKYISGRIKSFGYAFNGLKLVFLTQRNAQIHVAAAICAIIGGLYFRINHTQWLFISSAVAIVWLTEAFNTSLEALTDLASPDIHPLAAKAKDAAAAAVLIAAFYAIVVAALVFLPELVS